MVWGRFIGNRIFTGLPVNVEEIKDDSRELPPFGLVLGVILIPLILILISTVSKYMPIPEGVQNVLSFIGKPFLALTVATLAAMYFLGIRRGYTGAQLKKILDHSLRPVGMILLVIASGGVIRWMLQDSGLGYIIGPALEKSGMPLILVAFFIALLVRASVGSSMVAMTMASGIMATMPAVMATRTLTSERDRKMTILLTPFMSCTAKLPIYGFLLYGYSAQSRNRTPGGQMMKKIYPTLSRI